MDKRDRPVITIGDIVYVVVVVGGLALFIGSLCNYS